MLGSVSLFTHLSKLTKDRGHTPCGGSARLHLLLEARNGGRAGASHASAWARESPQRAPGPPRAQSRPRGRGERRACLCCPSWREGEGEGWPEAREARSHRQLLSRGSSVPTGARARTHLLVVLAQPDSHRIQLGHRVRALPKLAGRAPVLPPVHGQARGRRRTPCTRGACCRSRTAARCRGHGHRPSSPPPGLALAAFPVLTRARAQTPPPPPSPAQPTPFRRPGPAPPLPGTGAVTDWGRRAGVRMRSTLAAPAAGGAPRLFRPPLRTESRRLLSGFLRLSGRSAVGKRLLREPSRVCSASLGPALSASEPPPPAHSPTSASHGFTLFSVSRTTPAGFCGLEISFHFDTRTRGILKFMKISQKTGP